MTTLYELATQYQVVAAQLADLDLDEQTMLDTLDGEAWPVEEKARAVTAMILNMQADADMVSIVAAKMSKKAKALQSRADWMHDYLMTNMQRCGITEIKALDGTFTAKMHRNRDCSVEIIGQIPDEYTRLVPEKREPDKTAIKAAIKAGNDVEGARLVYSDRLEIK